MMDSDGDRAGLAAGYRGVEQAQPRGLRLLGESRGDVGADAGEVDDERPLARAVEHTVLAGEDLLHVRGVRDHHRPDVGIPYRLGDRVGTPPAALDQRGHFLR
jgi:hypothetical protein